MPKGIPNKRYTPEFKKLVIETMLEEKLSYSETARRFEVSDHHLIQKMRNDIAEEYIRQFLSQMRELGFEGSETVEMLEKPLKGGKQ